MAQILRHLIERRNRRQARRHVQAADASRDRRDWGAAADQYARALALSPAQPSLLVQYGNVRKEEGLRDQAEAAYRDALVQEPENSDTWLQLGHVLKLLGRIPEAVDAYETALQLDPTHRSARAELAALGAHDRIPFPPQHQLDFASRIESVVRELADIDQMLQPYLDSGRSYSAFRKAHPVTPPPAITAGQSAFQIVIDGRGRLAAELAATTRSLSDQTFENWRAYCLVDAAMMQHPVASLPFVDQRFAFDVAWPSPDEGLVLLMSAGTVLGPSALRWFQFTHDRTRCTASYADHDRAVETWRGAREHHSPTLQPTFDPDWFGDRLTPPAVICVDSQFFRMLESGEDFGFSLCRVASAGGTIVHVPRLLSTLLDVIQPVRQAPADPVAAIAMKDRDIGVAGSELPQVHVAVIIPTRDQADLLVKCVEAIMRAGRSGDKLEIIIVDNKSQEQKTFVALADLEKRFGARVVAFDEPFNWSRANNQGAKSTTAEILLFLNNDTEMLTLGWSAVIGGLLNRDEIGAIGARLLYPDFSVQHAGIVFGLGDGAPRHEGVGSAQDFGGPDNRWLRRRSVAAVTGAFLAMRRTVWEEAGGFDEALAVGYNDVDMALHIRSLGYRILYAPEVQLIHHESKTRGMNVTRSQIAWDREELKRLYEKWGAKLFFDPSINPQWHREIGEFQAYREPATSEILSAIDAQA